MNSVRLKYYFLLLLILLGSAGYAAQTPARKFSDEKINRLQQEHEYGSYETPEKAEPKKAEKKDNRSNAIEEWLASVFKMLDRIPAVVIYVIAFILLLVLLFVVLNMTGNLPFGKSSADQVQEEKTVHEENIHDIEFNKEIQLALKQGDYRKAVRLYYLASLKLLSDKKLINWQSYKTNREYIRELRTTELKTKLEDVTFMFELVWYGEVEMGKEVFDEIFVEMQNFQQAIKRTL